MIDAHSHIVHFRRSKWLKLILEDYSRGQFSAIIAVSNNFMEYVQLLQLIEGNTPFKVYIGLGLHPELKWHKNEANDFIDSVYQVISTDVRADIIGEIGIAEKVSSVIKRRQLELLEKVLNKLKGTDHPLSLHIPSAYVNTVISLLNRYDIRSAHFHWFRGKKAEAISLTEAGNFISWPPPVVSKNSTLKIISSINPSQLLFETDLHQKPNGKPSIMPSSIKDAMTIVAAKLEMNEKELKLLIQNNLIRLLGTSHSNYTAI